jgi:hypothetical protein
MTDGAQRMAAKAPMGDAKRLARDLEHPEPGPADVGDLRPRPPPRIDDVVLHDAHDPRAPGFDSLLEACREDVLADHTHDLPGGRPVVDTAGHRETRVDAQLHHDFRAEGVGPDSVEDRSHRNVQLSERLVQACGHSGSLAREEEHANITARIERNKRRFDGQQ